MTNQYSNLALDGQKFGMLRVVGRADMHGPQGMTLWWCSCDCSDIALVGTNKLRTGHKRSCGCLHRRTGADNPNADNRPVLDRLAERSYTVLATGCKVWTGPLKSSFGHGMISVVGKMTVTHRAAWEAERGPIPDGLDCLHDCPGGDNPACWNVDHLWLGTQGDNNADRDRKGRHVALKGEAHGCAKLCAESVLAIRADDRLHTLIAADYGISLGHVGHIKKRLVWKHI